MKSDLCSKPSYLETLENRLAALEHELQQSRRHGDTAKIAPVRPESDHGPVQRGPPFFDSEDSFPLQGHDGRSGRASLEASVHPLPPSEPDDLAHRVLFCDPEPEVYHGWFSKC